MVRPYCVSSVLCFYYSSFCTPLSNQAIPSTFPKHSLPFPASYLFSCCFFCQEYSYYSLCLPPKFYHFFSLMLKYEFLQHALSFSTLTKATISHGTFLIQFCAAVTDIHLTVSRRQRSPCALLCDTSSRSLAPFKWALR